MSGLVLALVGTDHHPFDRLVRWMDAAASFHPEARFVVQHGAPGGRFGFAPLAADRFLAWGRSSARQLVDWGVPSETVHVTDNGGTLTVTRIEHLSPEESQS